MKVASVLICIFCFGIPLANAQMKLGFPDLTCPDWTTENLPILRQRLARGNEAIEPELGPTLDETAYFWALGGWLAFPLGYANPWPPIKEIIVNEKIYTQFLEDTEKTEYRNEVNGEESPRLSLDQYELLFSFWMPTRRFVERNLGSVPSFRPCEAGRPPPTGAEYVVRARVVWPFLPNSETAPGAAVFRAQAKRLDEGRPLGLQELNSYEHNWNGPISGEKNYVIYSDDGDVAVSLICSAPLSRRIGLNPSCRGDVWQRSTDLILFLVFPSSEGQIGTEERWRAPVASAIDLVTSWRK